MKCYVGLALLLVAFASGCARQNDLEGGGRVKVGNENIELDFDENSGNLIRIYDRKTETDFLAQGEGGYSLLIDAGQGDIWQTDPEGALRLDSEAVQGEIVRKGKDTLEITKRFEIGEGREDIVVVQRITVTGSEAGMQYEISSQDENCTVLAIESRALTGLEGDYDLLWPYKEGEIKENALKPYREGIYPERKAGYPVPFSMQYVALFNDDVSLYFGVHDENADYKEYRLGQKKGESGYHPLLSVTMWPFLSRGTYCSPEVVVGVFQGGWHEAADRYRTFLEDAGWIREKGGMVRKLTGWYPATINMYPDSYRSSYVLEPGAAAPNGLPQLAREADALGVDMLHVLGWHLNGFDSRYPDYEFDPVLGGEEGFRRAAEEIHKQGDRVMMYMNNHISETQSRWFSEDDDGNGLCNGEQDGLRSAKGKLYYEDYGTGLSYVAMCPAAGSWRKALCAAAARLRDCGTDALWFDQMMEMPAVLCFDRNHGHTTPATAFSEGYRMMMEEMQALMEKDGDYLFAVEGVCDAYMQYIDVAGMMWARLLGFDSESRPEVTRYTLPITILGLPGYGKRGSAEGAYGRAFVMGEPFLVTADKNHQLAILTQQYRDYPEIYGAGIFRDTVGITIEEESILAGVIMAEEGGKAAVHLYNPTEKEIAVKGKLDEAALGFEVTWMEPWKHSEVSMNGEEFEVTLKPDGIAAIIVGTD